MRAIPRDDNSIALQGTYTVVGNGRKTVSSSGTPVQLSGTSTECKRIDIVALSANSGQVAIGGSTVVAASGSESGAIILPTGSYTLFVTNLNLIYIDSAVSGEGVSYTYFN